MSFKNYSYLHRPTFRRLIWITFSRILTFIIPNFVLYYVGGLKTSASRDAWREKIALLFSYLFIATFFCFWLEFISSYFCEPEKTYEWLEVFSNSSKANGINGKAVNWRNTNSDSEMVQWVNQYTHHDLSANFPTFMMLSRSTTDKPYDDNILNECIYNQNKSSQADAWLDYLLLNDPGYKYDKTRSEQPLYECPVPKHRNVSGAPCFYGSEFNNQFNSLPIKGDIEYDPDVISKLYNSLPTPNNATKLAYIILDGYVLDVTAYLSGATTIIPLSPTLSSRSFSKDRMFLPLDLTLFLYINLGRDITNSFNGNVTQNPTLYRNCLIHLFRKGVVPSYVPSGCRRINPALWATMGIGLLYFLIKMNLVYLSRFSFVQRFLFSSSPEHASAFIMQRSSSYQNLWPYTVLMVPCFAESSETLKQTLESLSRTTYADNRKLLLFVCDGIVTNAHEQKETHVLLLEHLGYSGGTEDSRPQPYHSLGQKSKKINYARVYSGYYESGRNRVPYLVIVKVGHEEEGIESGKGNRGKRDSLLIVLSFLERCMNLTHHQIAPLDYELFNQCYNVLGIDPRSFKYMLVTDADIQVQADVVQRLISRLEQDRLMLAVSGHVRPANPEENLTTMLQIFPVYLAYFSSLAYEACLKSVMSMNGGLIMYKIWTESLDGPRLRKQDWPKLSDEIIITNPFGDPIQRNRPKRSDEPTKDIELCCIHPTVLRGIATPEADTLHMESVLLLGEEKIIPMVLLRSHPGHRLGFEPDAVGYTPLPTRFLVLQGIQTRTIRAAFHVQLEMQRVAWQLGFGYGLVSTAQLLDTILSMPIMIYLYSVFFRAISQYGMAYFTIAYAFISLAAFNVLLFLLRRQFRYIAWFGLYCLLSLPLFAIWFPLLAVWQSNDSSYWYHSWPTQGHTRRHGIIDEGQEAEIVMTQPLPRMRLSQYEIAETKRLTLAAEAALDSNFVGFTTGFSEPIATPPLVQVRKGVHSTRTTNLRPSSLELYSASWKNRYPSLDEPPDDPFDDLYQAQEDSGFAKLPPVDHRDDQVEFDDRDSTLSISSSTFSIPQDPFEDTLEYPRHRVVMRHDPPDPSLFRLEDQGRSRAIHNFTTLPSTLRQS